MNIPKGNLGVPDKLKRVTDDLLVFTLLKTKLKTKTPVAARPRESGRKK